MSIDSLVVPTLVDTPPAVFTAKHVVDPFAPGRIGQPLSSAGDIQSVPGDRWQLADLPVDSLRVVGFLEVKGRYIGVIEGSAGSLNVKVGDRLGNQQAVIVNISKQGIRLRQTDGSESWMPISRRSR
jgi:Tfp pilus assembly protein PilP